MSATKKQVDEIEKRIDVLYEEEARTPRSWETSAALLLLGHAYRALGRDFRAEETAAPVDPDMEAMKYGLMQSLRWLHERPGRPKKGIKLDVDTAGLTWAQGYLALGAEYQMLVGGFTQYRSGVFTVSSLTDRELVFSGKVEDIAYDVADGLLHQSTVEHPRGAIIRSYSAFIEQVIRRAMPNPPNELSFVDLADELRAHMDAARPLVAGTFLLPDSWEFNGIGINVFRAFWTGMTLLALTQSIYCKLCYVDHHPANWRPTLRIRRADLVKVLATLTDTSESTTSRLVDLHVYNRQHPKSDIALTPFVDLGNYMIASPEIIITSRIERNFYAHAARAYKDVVDEMSGELSPAMTRKMEARFRKAGFLVASEVNVHTAVGDTDIDLLVWSPNERIIAALELKWYIHAGDFSEVLALNKKANESIEGQLGKYQLAISDGLQDLLLRAFPKEAGVHPSPTRTSVGLVMKNHTGRSILRRAWCWFAPEAALLKGLELTKSSLEKVIDGMERYSWLPRVGKEYEIHNNPVDCPGGDFQVSVPGYLFK